MIGSKKSEQVITARCVVWDLGEVMAWIQARRNASHTTKLKLAPLPDVHKRKRRQTTQRSVT